MDSWENIYLLSLTLQSGQKYGLHKIDILYSVVKSFLVGPGVNKKSLTWRFQAKHFQNFVYIWQKILVFFSSDRQFHNFLLVNVNVLLVMYSFGTYGTYVSDRQL